MYEGRANSAEGEASGGMNIVFWFGLILCTIYQSYRYPLQISSSGTSPTYSDTPLVWQAGKFILAFPLILVSIFRWPSVAARFDRWLIIIAVLFLSIFSFIKIVNGHDAQYLDLSFWMVFALALVLAVDKINVSSIDKFFYALLVYSFGSTVIEVFLFLAFGRLPALAWGGTYFVRFGGFLDDPNGFSGIIFLLMGWSYFRFNGARKFLIRSGLVISLLLTQSWTALAFFIGILIFYAVIAISKRPLIAIPSVFALPLLVVLAAGWFGRLQNGVLWELLQEKQGSIQGHAFPWEQWGSKWLDWALLGEWNYNAYESWWASAAVNFGLLWIAVYCAVVIALLVILQRETAKAPVKAKPIYAGLLLFGIYFALGSANLPYPIIFPINALFFLFAFLVAFKKIAYEGFAYAAPGKPLLARSAGNLAPE